MNKLLIPVALGALWSASALAQANSPDPLQQLLEQVRQSAAELSRENQAREATFRNARDRQAELLRQARAELAAAERRSEELKSTFDSNEKLLADLETQLRNEMGDIGEVFGIVRQNAGDARATFETSLVSAQIPGRGKFLGELAESKALPAISELERLWFEIQREITESGRIVTFNAPLLDPSGATSTQPVTRVGLFTASSGARFVDINSADSSLYILPRQPAARLTSAAATLAETSSGFPNAVVDPSRGAILGAFSAAPTLGETVKQGKLVGYVIITLGAFGLLICLWRGIDLAIVGSRLRSQSRTPEPRTNNPLGRVMAVFQKFNQPEHDLQTLELKLDEAILKETPALERGLPTIKILAAVAPLLGLLGTVTGMIQTFQSITLFGTGDPKIMAGGISEALVTTVLGLVISIPLVLLHSILSGKAEQYTQVLDEQAAGLVAEFAEKQKPDAA